MAQTGSLRSDTPPRLKEVFYFIPMQVALQLQKSGEYVAALDWYQTVYAFNLVDDPATAGVDEREIYYGLQLERNTQPNLSRFARWILDLNPHIIAAGRPNPYTRYTLMCIVRCFLEYADSEFTHDTGESLANARDLYLAARRMLASPDLQAPPVTDSTQGDCRSGPGIAVLAGREPIVKVPARAQHRGHEAASGITRTGCFPVWRSALGRRLRSIACATEPNAATYPVSLQCPDRAQQTTGQCCPAHGGQLPVLARKA